MKSLAVTPLQLPSTLRLTPPFSVNFNRRTSSSVTILGSNSRSFTLKCSAQKSPSLVENSEGFFEASKKGNLIPLYRCILSDHLTPVLAYRCLVKEDDREAPSFLFESVEPGVMGSNIGRYSMVGAQPAIEIVAKENMVTIMNHDEGKREEAIVDDPMVVPQRIMEGWRPQLIDELPEAFCGGWVGYFSYDTMRYAERKKLPFSSAPPDDRNLPDLHLGLYDDVIVFDHVAKKAYVIHWVRLDRYSSAEEAFNDGIQKLETLVSRVHDIVPPRLPAGSIKLHTHLFGPELKMSSMTSKEYKEAVLQAKEHILAGDIFQIVLSQRFERRTFADPFEVYRALRIVNPSPYMTYLQARGCIIVASSPEILTRVKKRKITNRPLAGTARRGKTPKEDLMLKRYVDVWGGELWIDVLRATLAYGLAPKSWTDYLYLSVGGTLSNAGISGQAFNHGPQISNVYELDVVTGKGELMTCSEEQNSELFHAVLGGLGQFGIITRARIPLEPAPQRVRWIRALYSNFTAFTKDQEFLISLHGHPNSQKFDYIEGFVIVDDGLINNWRSSFFSPRNPVKITSFNSNGGVLYCLEVTKNYDESSANSIDQEIEALLEKLDFIPTSVFTTDLPYVDFLDRVHKNELKLRSKGLWDVPHPWLNLFVPKSRISDFDKGVFKGILGNKTSGPILIYPMNKDKWDHRSSAVTPDEQVFYLVAFLRSALDTVIGGDESQSLEYLTNQNRQILRFCDDAGIKLKQYLPHYTTQEEWMDHFGDKWAQFYQRKMEFDPRRILATGQRIFKPSFSTKVASW